MLVRAQFDLPDETELCSLVGLAVDAARTKALMEITGRTTLSVGSNEYSDNFEIFFRVYEILLFIRDIHRNDEAALFFGFYPIVVCSKSDEQIQFVDRDTNASLGTCQLRELKAFSEPCDDFIRKTIGTVHSPLARFFLDRNFDEDPWRLR